MSFVYTPHKFRAARGEFAWQTADVRAMLVRQGSGAATAQDAATVAALGTLNEHDGAGYARAALDNQAVVQDDAQNRAELLADQWSFGAAVAASSTPVIGLVLYQHIDGTAANDRPIAYYDDGGFPFDGSGEPLTVTPDAQGLLIYA